MISTLTKRQQEVLDLLIEGASTEEIAHRMWITKATARNHVQSVLDKLDVGSRVAAVAYAREYADSPGERVVSWCRSQRMHLEQWQEDLIRKAFEPRESAATQMTVSGIGIVTTPPDC